jgi:cellulose synthase/poly-beta-1,6-N-acetylglucosamine synthase-like glycosyltransferase
LFIFNVFRFGFALVFIGLHCALMAGLFLEWLRDRRVYGEKNAGEEGKQGGGEISFSKAETSPPAKVSVIIPVHNEGARMGQMLQSLAVQNYPSVEIIFVDDRSDDESPGMLRDFAFQNAPPGGAVSRLETRIITLRENPGLNHKQYALEKGIKVSSGEFLLFTDADCKVPPGWIWAMARRMADTRVGIVIGPVFKRPEGRSFFYLYQCFDHAVRYMYLAASTGLGAAGGGFGNNLILRRKSLDLIGGYEQVPPSPTEDAALISRIRAKSAYRVCSALGSDTWVTTAGENSWRAFVNQTLRWNNGGLFSPDPITRFNFSFLMITISLGMLALPSLPFMPRLWPLPAAVLLSMAGNTIVTLRLFGLSLPKRKAAYIIQCIFTPMYFTFLTILGFCGIKVNWKGSPVNPQRF